MQVESFQRERGNCMFKAPVVEDKLKHGEWGGEWCRMTIVAHTIAFLPCERESRSVTSTTPWTKVHRILQARTLEWVPFPFSRGSSQPRDQTQVSHIPGVFLKVLNIWTQLIFVKIQRDKCYYDLHFTYERTVTERLSNVLKVIHLKLQIA